MPAPGPSGHGGTGALRSIGDRRLAGPLPTDRFLIPGTRRDFGSGDLVVMTSPGLGSFKDLLLGARQRELEIRRDIGKAKWQLGVASAGRALGWLSLLLVVAAPLRAKANALVQLRQGEIETLRSNLAATRIAVNFDMESEIAAPHRQMQSSFERLATSRRTWAVEAEQQIDRVKARSSAGTVVSRTPARLDRAAAPLVDTDDTPLALSVLRGRAMAHFYPGFVLIDSCNTAEIAVIDLTELDIAAGTTHFTETEGTPADSETVGSTWAKANKDGSRDRRFSHNMQLPILRYGSLRLSTREGLNEQFLFSDAHAPAAFAAATQALKYLLSRGRNEDRGRVAGTKRLERRS